MFSVLFSLAPCTHMTMTNISILHFLPIPTLLDLPVLPFPLLPPAPILLMSHLHEVDIDFLQLAPGYS